MAGEVGKLCRFFGPATSRFVGPEVDDSLDVSGRGGVSNSSGECDG